MRWRYKLSICVMVACLLLTACSSKQPATNVSPIDQGEELTEEGQTLTVINQDSSANNTSVTPVTEEGKKYLIQTRLTDFRLLSATKGLAWGSTRNELRLYLTQDSGKTWTNISPSSSVQFPNNPVFGSDLYFMDMNHGWIVRDSLGSGEAIVLRTSDGGATWKMTSLPDAYDVVSMYFLNEEYGWIVTTGDRSSSSEGTTVYRTTNGGATWKKIMETPLLPTNASSAELTLPKHGKPAGIVFTDEMTGYITLLEAGLPAVYETIDGGSTWTKNDTFFEIDKFQTCNRFNIGSPTLFGGMNSTGWIPVGCSREDTVKYNGYFTTDAGTTWALSALGLPWQSGSGGTLSTTFINAKEGWSIQKSSVWHTTDQGKTWSLLPESEKLAEVMSEYEEIVKVQFFDSQIGWLLVAKSDKKRSLLLQTQDGGVSWRVL